MEDCQSATNISINEKKLILSNKLPHEASEAYKAKFVMEIFKKFKTENNMLSHRRHFIMQKLKSNRNKEKEIMEKKTC